ncbi:IclR family transcriptional regulator [Yinghuangia sp. YIM S09857]|uniref:IclR family transcriptional regulator n=1 Tax=Yinghuangia sp. YIM S09857 TaxID=3436929 RepID=UPI003F5397D9
MIAVVEFLASRPTEPATVADVVRHLGLSRATCHAILASLVGAGWVLRDPAKKTFSAGPALIAVGRAAESGAPAAHAADSELAALAADLGMPATISYPIGDRLVIGSRSPAAVAADDEVRVGQRFPFAPPFAAGLVAWGAPGDFERWVSRAPDGGLESVEHLRGALAAVRRRGYSVISMSAAAWRLRALLSELDAFPSRKRPVIAGLLHDIGAVDHLSEDLAEGMSCPVGIMATPAFGVDGTAVLNISVHVWRERDAAAIRALGDRLLAASRAVTRQIGGRMPDDFPI